MAYSDVISSGQGVLEYYLAIEGFGYVMGTSSAAPSDAWYGGEVYTYHRGLRAGTIRRLCGARPEEVWPDLSGSDVEVDDPDETLAAYLRGMDGCGTGELTATLSATEVATIAINGTASLPAAPDVIHIDREAIYYIGKTATTITGLTRAVHGSEAVEHYFNDESFPAVRPVVSDGPVSLRGRRAVIYAAHHTDGGISASSQIWVGVVDGEFSFDGKVLRIPIAHGLQVWRAGQVAASLPIAPLRGLYVPNFEGCRYGRFSVGDPTNGDQYVDAVADGTAEFFETGQDFVDRVSAKVMSGTDGIVGWEMGQQGDGRVYVKCLTPPPGGGGGTNSPFIAWSGLAFVPLGFQAIEVGGGATAIWGLAGERLVAPRAPATFFAVVKTFVGTAAGFEPRLYHEEGWGARFIESAFELATGDTTDGLMGVINHISTVDDYLDFSPFCDALGTSTAWPESIATYGGVVPTVRQRWIIEGNVDDVARALWAGTTYPGSTWPYVLPDRWLPEPALRDGDVDWTELRALVASAPDVARRMYAVIDGARSVEDVLTGPLFACGVYAYVREDGVASWRRTVLPTQVEAVLGSTVDGSWIDADQVPSAGFEAQRNRVINAIKFTIKSASLLAYEQEKYCIVVNSQSEARFGARAWETITEDGALKDGLTLEVAAALSNDFSLLGQGLATYMAGTLALLGVPQPHVDLPVTVRGRALEIGDACLLTSPWVRSPITGRLGVTAQVCLVMGWERVEGYDDAAVDHLDLWLVGRPTQAISPAVLCSAWDAGDEELTVTDDDRYHRSDDTSDLNFFEVGDKVELVEYDSAAPDLGYATIDSIDTTTGVIGLGAVAGTITAPCIMRFRTWSGCTTDQQSEGWAWACDADDGLIEDDAAGGRWG